MDKYSGKGCLSVLYCMVDCCDMEMMTNDRLDRLKKVRFKTNENILMENH